MPQPTPTPTRSLTPTHDRTNPISNPDIALVCLHLRVWRLLSAAKRRRLSKLSALSRRGGVGGAPSPCSTEASLAEPLLQSAGARRSSSAFA
jgi:hypothetical protein